MNNSSDVHIISREEIIKACLLIAWETSTPEDVRAALKTVEMTQHFFASCLTHYLDRCMALSICSPAYSAGDVWVNNAGFQFKWKDHARNFRLECLGWKEVQTRCKKLLHEKEA